jgi:uncharacterized protein YbjT (DUF2867 family)
MIDTAGPIAVFGATGAQGGPVAHALLAAGRPVRAIARTEARLRDLADRGAEVRAVDLADADAVRHALIGVSAAFVHLPFLPVAAIVRAQATAVATGLRDAEVPLTVFTLSGPAPASPVGVASFDTKAIAKRVLSDAGVPLVGLEPTGYLGNLSAFFSAPGIVYHDELRYPLPADHRQPWISTEDQAALAIAALARPDLAGRWFRIGEQLTGPELADGIGEGRGRRVRYVPLDPDAFGRSLAPVMGEDLGAALAADYRMLASRPSALLLDGDTAALRRELGVPATPVPMWARSQDWEAAAAILGGM